MLSLLSCSTEQIIFIDEYQLEQLDNYATTHKLQESKW